MVRSMAGRDADRPALDRPILVTGTPRCGKTCVSQLLARADEFTLLAEPLSIWDIGKRGGDDLRSEAEATERVRRAIRRACQRAVQRAGKARYLDDLAYHAVRLPFVHRVLPEARIVHVVRDPATAIPEMAYWWGRPSETLAAALARKGRSLRLRTLPRLGLRFLRNSLHARRRGRPAAWGPRVPGLSEFAASHGPAEVAAFQWQKMMEIALADLERLPRDRWIEVRYERLLADPRGEAKRLAHFCEVADPRALVETAARHLDPEHPVFADAPPSDAEWARIRERIAPLRRRLGYP